MYGIIIDVRCTVYKTMTSNATEITAAKSDGNTTMILRERQSSRDADE